MTKGSIAFVLGLASLLVACGGSAGAHVETGGMPQSAWEVDTSDPLAARMREVGTQLRTAGLVVGPVQGRGFMAARQVETTGIEIPPDKCATIVALASNGVHDLDATLYAPSGDVLAEDVQPDAHPTIQVCAATRARRLYYTLRAYDGAGAYLFATFFGPRSSFVAAARVLGGRPGVAADTTSEVEHDGRMREFVDGVGRRGFRAQGEPIAVHFEADQRIRVPLAAENAQCYTVAGFVAGGLQDLDVRVLDEEGREVTRDIGPVTNPAVQFCAERDGDYSVELHAVRGAGDGRVVVLVSPESVTGGSSGLWLGARQETLVSRVPLDEATRNDATTARAAGYGRPARIATGHVVPGEAVAHAVRLGARRCSLVIATGGPGLGRWMLRLVTPDGALLAERVSHGASIDARVCSERRANAELQLVTRSGSGPYTVQVASKSFPRNMPSQATPAEYGALLDALESATADGWTFRALSSSTTDTSARGSTGATAHYVSLPSGQRVRLDLPSELRSCMRLAFIAAGGGAIDVSLRRGNRSLTREGERKGDLHLCAPGAGTVELSAKPGTNGAFLVLFDR